MTQLEALKYIEDHPKDDPKVNELTAELVRRFWNCPCGAETIVTPSGITCPECGRVLMAT